MQNYVEQAIRTESLDLFKVDSARLLHAAIGVSTEVAELITAPPGDMENVKEELGDICWYLAIACHSMRIEFDDLSLLATVEEPELLVDPIKILGQSAGEALDVIKRGLFYGVELDEPKLAEHLGNVLAVVNKVSIEEGWSLAELQAGNIAKLSSRYPEKFTTEAAVNRDTAAEMEALSSRSQD